ncbi:MAG: potassium transporter TrkG [Pseudomonadota bacterium]|nr:potassium transporter TrkG [Pseudomonadota bacterium]
MFLRGDKLKKISPELAIFLTFSLLIALGVILLQLPFVHHAASLCPLDAVFTSTSAVCVTGLTTVPTSGFNLPGQLVLLVLIQLGAIGIMTLTSSLILFFRGDLDLRMRVDASQLSSSNSLREGRGILRTVVIYTFTMELVGFILLFIGFRRQGLTMDESLYQGIFHTISAFCNAGFSPLDDSLIGSNMLIKGSVMMLIITGGLGYYVIFDLWEYVKKKDRITLYTKMVLLLTPGIIVAGAAALLFFEYPGMSVIDALFQSVTARTAGFNTVNLAALQPASLLILIVLMIIGTAPGSTGGGIKITTFFVVMLTCYQVVRGRRKIVIYGRKLSINTILRAFTMIAFYLLFLALGCLVLLYFEQASFVITLFEITSALGTVGLSLGATGEWGVLGKSVLIAVMFIGRIGPAVLAIILLKENEMSHVDYPEEKIILG